MVSAGGMTATACAGVASACMIGATTAARIGMMVIVIGMMVSMSTETTVIIGDANVRTRVVGWAIVTWPIVTGIIPDIPTRRTTGQQEWYQC